MNKNNQQQIIPKCRVLRLKKNDGTLQLISNYPSIQSAAIAMGVKPETIYHYCRAVGETLKGSILMAY